MSELIKYTTQDGYDVIVETNSDESPNHTYRGSPGVRGVISEATQSLEDALTPLHKITSSLINSLKDLANSPDEVQVELGLKFSAKAGVILTSVDGESNLNVVLKWTKDSEK